MNEASPNVPRSTRVAPPIRAVFDTRVLQSAIWGGRASTLAVDAWLDERVHLCVTEVIMTEYFRLLRRLTPTPLLREVLDRLRSGEAVRAFIVRAGGGPPEDHLIACAQAAGAVALVTHDEALLDLVQVGGVAIVSPGEFARRFLLETPVQC
jgi:predicted nucleic acid-binding protein